MSIFMETNYDLLVNDIEMLRCCGIGIAMGNSNPILKDIADHVTTDVDKDGLKNAFEHYGLI